MAAKLSITIGLPSKETGRMMRWGNSGHLHLWESLWDQDAVGLSWFL
jgi:hypothetical protein